MMLIPGAGFNSHPSYNKEDSMMHYRKPEIVSCKPALSAVQKIQKGPIPIPDAFRLQETPAAYEADE
jgi:hypothetical protein